LRATVSCYLASDKLHRLNYKRLLFLLNYIKFTDIDGYFYVKKENYFFMLESSYDSKFIQLDDNTFNLLMPLHNKLIKQHLKKVSDYFEYSEYYLINLKTGEYICFDYM